MAFSNVTDPSIECWGPGVLNLQSRPSIIPSDILYALTPADPYSAPWMHRCCSPNPVNWINGCYAWCEIPPAPERGDGEVGAGVSDQSYFFDCLRSTGWPENLWGQGWTSTYSLSENGAVAAAGRVSSGGIMGWGVVAFALVAGLGSWGWGSGV